jgi:hypothetical protein
VLISTSHLIHGKHVIEVSGSMLLKVTLVFYLRREYCVRSMTFILDVGSCLNLAPFQ